MTRRTALVAVIVSAACFATLGILTKFAFAGGADPQSMLTWRFAIAAVVMGATQLVRAPRQMRVTPADLGRFSLLALSGYGFASMCYSFAVREIGASVTTVLLYTYPAIVAVIGRVFLREPLPPRRIAAVALTFAGSALVADVFAGAGSVTLRGLALGLGAGLGYAVFNVLSYRVLDRRPRLVIMAYTFGISAIGIAIVTTLTTGFPTTSAWTMGAWVSLGLIVLIPTFAAVLLYLGGIKGMGAPQAAVISTIELPFTILLAAAFVGERLSAVQWLGAAVVLAGVVLAEWGSVGIDMDGAPAI
jgi:drug/metabolite transporter (DMT)-like permease